MASLTAIFGLATNWVSGLVTPDQLQQFLGENFFWKLVGILVVSAVLLAMLTVYGEKWLSKSENSIKPASKNFEPEIRVEEKKATAQSPKSEAKTESNNGLPAWMWRKLPEWL